MLERDKLEKVGLEAISLKVSRGRNKVSYIVTDLQEAIRNQEDNERYIIDIFIDILGIEEGTGEEISIGKLEGNFFESEFVMEHTDFYEICDCAGRDLEPLAAAIVDKDRCIKCGRCYISCFDGGHQAYTYNEESREITLNKDKCVGCHLCSLVCPVQAINKGEIMFRDGNTRNIVI